MLEQLIKMHGPLSKRLEAAEPKAQQDISLKGHLDFLCGLLGAYGARCVTGFDSTDMFVAIEYPLAFSLLPTLPLYLVL